MANINPNIKPGGLSQKDLVDALYMAFSSLYGICAQLDADMAAPPSGTYVANCWTALINVIIVDSKGNRTGQGIAESSAIEPTHIITPTGISVAALLAAIYQFHNAFETLTEQLDGDSLTFTNYEATSYIAVFLQMVKNSKGNILGNSKTYYFRPGGTYPEDKLVDCLYSFFKGINLLTADNTTTGLDGDATVTATNYEALWYTANLLLLIEDSVGNTIGISR